MPAFNLRESFQSGQKIGLQQQKIGIARDTLIQKGEQAATAQANKELEREYSTASNDKLPIPVRAIAVNKILNTVGLDSRSYQDEDRLNKDTKVIVGLKKWLEDNPDIEPEEGAKFIQTALSGGEQRGTETVTTQPTQVDRIGGFEFPTETKAREKAEATQRAIDEGFVTPEQLAQKELLGAVQTRTGAAIPTDIDDFVERATIVHKHTNPTAKPHEIAQMQNDAAKEFKRAQAEEAGKVRFAQRNADALTAGRIANNSETAKQLVLIKHAGDLAKARGKETDIDKKTTAKTRMEGNLAILGQHFLNLDGMGAMVNVDKPAMSNVFARVRSSDLGQFVENSFGTDAQSIRNSINKLKPLIIQDIRASTDMGTRGLDTEKELAFYLQAAGDETTDIQSNIAAVIVLSEAFGLGEVSANLRQHTDESLIQRISTEGRALNPPRTNIEGMQTIDMPDGSVQIFDASGKRVE